LWFRSTLLRVTKYEHSVDYPPREIKDDREIIITDEFSGKKINLFREGKNIICEHYSGYAKFSVKKILRKCCYKIVFDVNGDYNIKVNGKEINGNLISWQQSVECNVEIGKLALRNINHAF